MATTEAVKAAVSNGGQQLTKGDRLESLLERLDIKSRLDAILGKRSSVFASSILSLVKSTPQLQGCNPITVIGSAMVAATLDLPINKNLGFAYIVPYKDEAQFQMGYKGFIQLAIRTGQYKTIHTTEIYQDEIKVWNPLRAEIEFTDQSNWKQRDAGETDKIIGYMAFFKLLNGFEKTIYMTKNQVTNHAKRYSQSYGNPKALWMKDFHSMALKTPLKLLLSKYGILSVEMQTALRADQAVIKDTTGEVSDASYPDAIPSEADESPTPSATAPVPPVSEKTGEEIGFGEPRL